MVSAAHFALLNVVSRLAAYRSLLQLHSRWIVAFSSPITSSLQLLLIDDSTQQEVACLEGPCLFRINRAEEYQIFIDNDQQGPNDTIWVHLVIASALLVAKQHKELAHNAAQKAAEQALKGKKPRAGQRFAYTHGDVTFEI